ncbi:helix-turn-helix domain-containing protein [Sphingomonas yabuuchiae]|uniref:Helix-turn-helix transcriptional regulator n=1 Tax=Sphingomonas yabuuchiae TaxID=172044 RepID=A0AA40ZWG2_9SPHN|nr:helix-turn-helix transcriptional regulator [Sphingomonas yabuuchiae]MBB4611650.1 transcriptional regulator with XRE-family HTH domain [Sphingomonas yabuuchiae]MBN3556762.1 helix-turn-helix transcriptional regulator [Sphingomonas yabuuchiae]
MTLKEWLDREAMSVPQFATRIGRSAEAVRRYVSGERIPDKDTMPLIAEATQRKVTPNDFFDLTPIKRRRSMPSQVAA